MEKKKTCNMKNEICRKVDEEKYREKNKQTNKKDKVSDVKLQKENTWILKVMGKGKNRLLALSAVACKLAGFSSSSYQLQHG